MVDLIPFEQIGTAIQYASDVKDLYDTATTVKSIYDRRISPYFRSTAPKRGT